ncbi:hypothetical protein LP419_39570 [Massilia sp. H-1]|nr:hypothetical protein LP419_39570 [Massilia sp. H-1]
MGISLALAIGTDVAIATTQRSLLVRQRAIGINARNTSNTGAKAKASVAGGDSADEPAEGSPDADQGGVNKKAADNKTFASNRATSKGADAGTTGDIGGASAEGEGGNKVQVAGAAEHRGADLDRARPWPTT